MKITFFIGISPRVIPSINSEYSLPANTKSASLRISLNETEVSDSVKGRTTYDVDDISITSLN